MRLIRFLRSLSRKTRIIISTILVVNEIIIVSLWAHYDIYYKTYKLTPDDCDQIMTCSPTEFLNGNGEDSRYYNLFSAAKLDKRGNLNMILNKKARKFIADRSYEVIENAESNGIEFSDDFSEVTIYSYEETIMIDIFKSIDILNACEDLLFLRHIYPSEKPVKLIIRDAVTYDKVVTHYHHDEDTYNQSDFDISSREDAVS